MKRPAPKGPTEGPWSASSEPDPIGKRYVIHSIPTATGVAFCWTQGDADLIAAAPELYEALALFVQGVDEFWSVPGRAKEALAKARTALAKASPAPKEKP